MTSSTPLRLHLRLAAQVRCGLRIALLWLIAASGLLPPAQAGGVQDLRRINDAANDHPKATVASVLQEIEAARAAGDAQTEFWLLLGLGRAHGALEADAASRQAVREAESALARVATASERHRTWLRLEKISAALRSAEPQQLAQLMVDVQRSARAVGDEALICDARSLDSWLLSLLDAFDEAWTATEETESCARALGDTRLEASAIMQLGSLSSKVGGRIPTAASEQDYFGRALRAIDGQRLRFLRSLVEWELGKAYALDDKGGGIAIVHYQNAAALSREIDDEAGLAAADIEIARLKLKQGEFTEALRLSREARQRLKVIGSDSRLPAAATVAIDALTKLQRPEVLREIAAAQALDLSTETGAGRARLARAIADGYASQGLHQQAYAELQRANTLADDGKKVVRDQQALRLQARYDAVSRDAENARLRHDTETATLRLRAQEADRQALWAALFTLALLLATLSFFSVRALAHRRRLADLALRDDLTGLPNRRAVMAFAREQFKQSRALGLPLAVAVIDLDHFKLVNDRHGHATGDMVLRSFAESAASVIRGQDRIGRIGGEEWLLVMPGTDGREMPAVFARLREHFAAARIEGMPQPHGCTFSLGGAQLNGSVANIDDLIAVADRQLYAAKAGGRDTLRHAA
jgi:diguanylate cyclase (GGDEF)-like protein